MPRTAAIFSVLFLALSLVDLSAAEKKADPRLLEAAQQQDLPKVRALLEAGADVDTASRYGATALFFACDKGNLELVELLLEHGATVNLRDSFYQATPTGWALFKTSDSPAHRRIVARLLEQGADEAPDALKAGVRLGDPDLVRAALKSGKVSASDVEGARIKARQGGQEEITALLEELLETLPENLREDHPPVRLTAEELEPFAGTYQSEDGEQTVEILLDDEALWARLGQRPPVLLIPTAARSFSVYEVPGMTVAFSGRGGLVESFVQAFGDEETGFRRVEPEKAPDSAAAKAAATAAPTPAEAPAEASSHPEPSPLPEAKRLAPIHWPSFRGPNASGIGDGQGVPLAWNGEEGSNIRWKTPIPGIALSSPIVWGDRVFVTTAASQEADTTFRTGLYGDVDSVDDGSPHAFQVYALAKGTGEILWQRTATEGPPKVKRHTKSSHANPTPVTDGRHLVVSFSSEGLFCYDFEGKLLWKKDLGVLVSGWFYDPTYEWGFASSPILHDGKVIVQVDIQEGSFLAAFEISSGKEVWRTARQEIPSWATPAILPARDGEGPDEIITNAPKIRGYDASTGQELWSLTPNSEIVVGTPVVADGIAYVTGGYPPARPIYAIEAGGRGDLTLPEGETSSAHIRWSSRQGGTYIPSPIVYRGILYLLNNNGRLAAYDAETGERIYRQRVGRGESFSGSPVAADGRLYLTTEEGRTFVLRAGKTYEVLAQNELGEVVMTVPAISDGLLILRGMDHVYGIGAEPEADREPAVGTSPES